MCGISSVFFLHNQLLTCSSREMVSSLTPFILLQTLCYTPHMVTHRTVFAQLLSHLRCVKGDLGVYEQVRREESCVGTNTFVWSSILPLYPSPALICSYSLLDHLYTYSLPHLYSCSLLHSFYPPTSFPFPLSTPSLLPRLASQQATLEEQIKRQEGSIGVLQEHLNGLQPSLENLRKTSLPLQELLNTPLDKQREDYEVALLLPM